MDHPLIDLISAKIAEAEARGEFENLSGAGKPLPKVDDPENALVNRIMKEAGGMPEYVSLAKEIAALREALRDEADRDRRKELMQKIADLEPRLALAKDAYTR